jgi:hypothetical protein
MKILELTILIAVFIFFFFFQKEKVSHVPVSPEDVTTKKSKRVLTDSVQKKVHREDPFPQMNYVSSSSMGKTFTQEMPLSLALEGMWLDQLHEHLVVIDPEKGEEIFHKILEEKSLHDEQLNQNLLLGIESLSSLNGESGYDEIDGEDGVVKIQDPIILEEKHQRRVKGILGDHYEYIKEKEAEEGDNLQF